VHLSCMGLISANKRPITSDTGTYAIPQQRCGIYSVPFEAQGFCALTLQQVVRAAGRTRTLNATLDIQF
jgi:hypothetical protein